MTGRGMGYPASRDVLDLLRGIPEIEYNTPDDVTKEIERLESERVRPPKPKAQ